MKLMDWRLRSAILGSLFFCLLVPFNYGICAKLTTSPKLLVPQVHRRAMIWSSGFASTTPPGAWGEYTYWRRTDTFGPTLGYPTEAASVSGIAPYPHSLPGVFLADLDRVVGELSKESGPLELAIALFSRASIGPGSDGSLYLFLEHDNGEKVLFYRFLDSLLVTLEKYPNAMERLTLNLALESSFAGQAIEDFSYHSLAKRLKQYSVFTTASYNQEVAIGTLTDMWDDAEAIERVLKKKRLHICLNCSLVERRVFILTLFPYWAAQTPVTPQAIGTHRKLSAATLEDRMKVAATFNRVPFASERLVRIAANYFRELFRAQPESKEQFYKLRDLQLAGDQDFQVIIDVMDALDADNVIASCCDIFEMGSCQNFKNAR